MSQTNEFAKAINPDFVYFDLQSTNTYNNETGLAPQLQFLESRDIAVIDNAGEYNMSVTRFSVDTANLPVLVVEPDITGAEAFDAGKTIHRVAVITEGASLQIDSAGAVSTTLVDTLSSDGLGGDGMPTGRFGYSVASSDNGEVIVIGEPDASSLPYELYTLSGYYITASLRGQVYIGVRNESGTYNMARITDIGFRNSSDNVENGVIYPNINRSGDVVSGWKMGQNVAISGDGNIIFIGSSSDCPYYWIFNRLTGARHRHNKSVSYSLSVGALNTNGTLYIVGYPAKSTGIYFHGGYDILAFNPETGVSTTRLSVSGTAGTDIFMGLSVAINGVGNIAVATKTISATAGSINVIHSTASPHYVSSYSTYSYASSLDQFGQSISINNAGTLIAVGASLENTTGKVRILQYASGAITDQTGGLIAPSTFTGSIGFGYSVALSYDGNTIHIGIPNLNTNTGAVQSFQYSNSTWNYKAVSTGVATSTYYGYSVASNADGTEYLAGVQINAGTRVFRLDIATNENLPSTLINSASVANVYWTPDNTTLLQPTKSQLNGVNTATFAYYHCHSYNNFIDKVNDAIREAYVANFNRLWVEWVNILGVNNATFIKAEFINIVARCFSTPPYMVWNSTLDANLYLNTLFSVLGNYYAPSRTFSTSGTTQVSTSGATQPFRLKLAFNASLYSLFSSFPATETIIDGEKFFILNVPNQVPLLQDNSTIPLRALPLIPDYPFLYPYYDTATRVFSIPYPVGSISSYPLQDYFILLKQEISTIDAWCPVGSIVFTSNQLPIIPSQFSSSNTTGNVPNSATIGNRFALVITDLMTNQQGYRPNLIYNPTAEYRRLALTGNMGIRNIDINVFWRSKTGQLLPFRLQSGGSASLKLLFEKKDRNPDRLKEVAPDVVDIMGGRMPRSRR